MRLKNKNIIVTAAAQGIGKATALTFAKEGANIIATDINHKKLSELQKENNNIKVVKLDSTDKTSVEKFASTVDKIDVLFHAVGFVHHGSILDCSSEEFHNSMNINVYSAYLMTSVFIPKMLAKNFTDKSVFGWYNMKEYGRNNTDNSFEVILWPNDTFEY